MCSRNVLSIEADQESKPNKRQYLGLPTLSIPSMFTGTADTAASASAATATNQMVPPPIPDGNQISGSLSNRAYTIALQNQFCNLTDFSILPIDKVRAQIPTAAELSACVFSDDEKDSHGKNSHGSGSNGTEQSR